MVYAVRTTPTLPLVGAAVVGVVKLAIKDADQGHLDRVRAARRGEWLRAGPRPARCATPCGCCAHPKRLWREQRRWRSG